MIIFRKSYFVLYNWIVAGKKLKNEEADEVHRLIGIDILTAPIMWSYLFNSIYCIDSDVLVITAWICTISHMIGPLVYKVSGSMLFSINWLLACGYIFQSTHAFYSGGFYSSTLLWLSILPFIAGIVIGRGMMVAWSFLSLTTVGMFFVFNNKTMDIISESGRIWSQLNIALGYIILNLLSMTLYIYFKDKNKEYLQSKNESINKLLQIVCHDIANPLMSIILRVKRLRTKVSVSEEALKNIEGIDIASVMIKEILENTRKLEAINQGKIENSFDEVSLNDIIESSIFLFKEQLEKKQIKINYDFDEYKNVFLLADSISVKHQVFNNLFSNSIKFMNAKGEISISVKSEENNLEVIFSDTGKGMVLTELKNIFRSDIKTSHIGTDGEIGTGFGLPILYSTMMSFGATVTVSSVPKGPDVDNHGTTFKLKFKRHSKSTNSTKIILYN